MFKAFVIATRNWHGSARNTSVSTNRQSNKFLIDWKRAILIVFMLFGLLVWNGSVQGRGSSSLNRTLKTIVKEVLPKGYTASVQIADLDTGTILMQHHPDLALIPASTMKVITTSAALRILNPEFTFTTEVLATDLKGQSVGNLYMRGTGDPYLVSERLFALATEVVARGVKEIRNNIIVDDSYFVPGKPLDESEDLGTRSYHAPYSALSLNFNSIKLTVWPAAKPGQTAFATLTPSSGYARVKSAVKTVKGSQSATLHISKAVHPSGGEIITVGGTIGESAPAKSRYVNVANPALYTGEVFKDYIQRAGIQMTGQVVKGKVPSSAAALVEYNSLPLSLIVYWLNKYSNNFMAEQLGLALGAHKYGPPGTRQKGLATLRSYLNTLGIDPKTVSLSEASGLSRKNRVSAAVMVKVLIDTMRAFSYNYEFISSFGIAGVDGTLKKKFTTPNVKRRIRAKTGNLRGVNALAGYGLSKQGSVFAFAIIVNRKKQGGNYVDYAEQILERMLNTPMELW